MKGSLYGDLDRYDSTSSSAPAANSNFKQGPTSASKVGSNTLTSAAAIAAAQFFAPRALMKKSLPTQTQTQTQTQHHKPVIKPEFFTFVTSHIDGTDKVATPPTDASLINQIITHSPSRVTSDTPAAHTSSDSETNHLLSPSSVSTSTIDFLSLFEDIADEYHPSKPNDYQQICFDRLEKKKQNEKDRKEKEEKDRKEREEQERKEKVRLATRIVWEEEDTEETTKTNQAKRRSFDEADDSHPHDTDRIRDHDRDRDRNGDQGGEARKRAEAPRSHPPSFSSAGSASKLDLSISDGNEAYKRRRQLSSSSRM